MPHVEIKDRLLSHSPLLHKQRQSFRVLSSYRERGFPNILFPTPFNPRTTIRIPVHYPLSTTKLPPQGKNACPLGNRPTVTTYRIVAVGILIFIINFRSGAVSYWGSHGLPRAILKISIRRSDFTKRKIIPAVRIKIACFFLLQAQYNHTLPPRVSFLFQKWYY